MWLDDNLFLFNMGHLSPCVVQRRERVEDEGILYPHFFNPTHSPTLVLQLKLREKGRMRRKKETEKTKQKSSLPGKSLKFLMFYWRDLLFYWSDRGRWDRSWCAKKQSFFQSNPMTSAWFLFIIYWINSIKHEDLLNEGLMKILWQLRILGICFERTSLLSFPSFSSLFLLLLPFSLSLS